MNTVQKIAKNTGVLLLSNVISKILAFFFIVYTARYLGAEGLGILSFALAFTAIFGVFADLGLGTLTIREVARDKSLVEKYLGNLLAIKTILVIITFGLIALTVNLLDYPEETIKVVYIIALSVVFTAFTQMFNSIFQAFEKMEYVSGGMILSSALLLLGALFAIKKDFGVVGFASVYVLASVIVLGYSFIISTWKFIIPKMKVDLVFWKKTLRAASPFLISAILLAFYTRIDIMMLSLMQGDKEVGWYSAAWKIVEAFLSIPAIYMMAIFPVMSSFYKFSNNSLRVLYQKSFRYLFVLGLPIGISITILADRFISLIYGAEFIQSVPALQILIWVLIFSFFIYLLGHLLAAINQQRLNALSAGMGVVINVSLNLALIPLFSHLGASISTLITQIMLFLCFIIF